jgi:phage tail-like protein
MNGETGFFYLNTNNEWPTFELDGLEIAADGTLSLAPAAGGVGPRGVFRGGPFEAPAGPTPWHRLQVFTGPLPVGAHIQLFTFTGDGIDAPYDPAAGSPFADPGWRAAPRDVLDTLILNPPANRLWIGGVVRSDGQTSPVLHQMRVDYGRDTYLSFLPAIYSKDEAQRDFLERFLSLHESFLGGVEQAIADLPLLFDAEAAPAGGFPSWLAWLAGWLTFELDEAWSEAQSRHYLAEAFELYGKRGTVEGLRRYLELYAGVQARIVEPGQEATLWSLGENSLLGFTTMLASGSAQGAVLGTSATLDRSHLARGDDFGAALFEDVAHRFCVHVFCAELTRPSALEDVRAVIEREKPAHTTYHLCVIEPRMRVGAQARVGIDAIVGQGPPAAQLGMVLGLGTLAAAAEPCRIEEDR